MVIVVIVTIVVRVVYIVRVVRVVQVGRTGPALNLSPRTAVRIIAARCTINVNVTSFLDFGQSVIVRRAFIARSTRTTRLAIRRISRDRRLHSF